MKIFDRFFDKVMPFKYIDGIRINLDEDSCIKKVRIIKDGEEIIITRDNFNEFWHHSINGVKK